MKIVFRGMKGVGKTSLFDVFQGKPCPEKYVPSQEINTTHVFWTNPTTKDRVKVRSFGLSNDFDRLRFGMLWTSQMKLKRIRYQLRPLQVIGFQSH